MTPVKCDYHYLLQMKDVSDDQSLQQLLLSASDVVINCGYSKPLASAKLSYTAPIYC